MWRRQWLPLLMLHACRVASHQPPAHHQLACQLANLQDQFDVMDFSDNDIRKLDGFPKLKRLKTLLLNNNRIR